MILSIDCGSTNHKAALYSFRSFRVNDGRLQQLAASSMPVVYTVREARLAEFDAEKIWQDTVMLIRQVCAAAKTTPIQIKTITMTSQAQTFTILNSTGKPVMPFVSWMDKRAEAESDELSRRFGDDFHRHCSFPRPMPQLQLSKLLWMVRNHPERLKNSAMVVSLPGFLSLRFAGVNGIDNNLAAMSGLYSLALGDWWPAALEAVGLKREQLGKLVKIGVAVPAKCACKELIFSPEVKIVFAGNDQTASAFGNFCSRTNVLVSLGTALVVYRVMGRRRGPYTAEGCWGPYPGGGYYELATRNHGCAALDWARHRLTPGRNIQSFTELAMKAMIRRHEAGRRKPEALFCPNAMNTECAWVGSSEPGERALAVFEGIGFTLKQMIEDNLCMLSPLPEARMVGGGSTNVFWLQLLADILNTRVVCGSGDALFGAARQACSCALARQEEFFGTVFQPQDAEACMTRYEWWKQQFGMRQRV